MSRVKKILLASLVLAMGFGLAWPFRNTALRQEEEVSRLHAVGVSSGLAARDKAQLDSTGVATRPIATLTASETTDAPITPTSESSLEPSKSTFDLANHPAIARAPSLPKTPTKNISVPSSDAATASPPIVRESQAPQEVVHIVRGNDTLEKIAQRYLGDPGRAFEIFDFNRNQLDNPHQPLPIGAELRVRVDPGYQID